MDSSFLLKISLIGHIPKCISCNTTGSCDCFTLLCKTTGLCCWLIFSLWLFWAQSLIGSYRWFLLSDIKLGGYCWISLILFHLFKTIFHAHVKRFPFCKTFHSCFGRQNLWCSKNSLWHIFHLLLLLKTRLLQSPPLLSQRSQWNPLKVFNIHQIKEFANIPNSAVEELKCSCASSDSMLHISGAVMMAASRDVCCFGSCWEWDSLCRCGRGETGGRQGCKWGTVCHLGLSSSAAWRAKSSVWP